MRFLYEYMVEEYINSSRRKRETGNEEDDYPAGEDADPIASGNTIPLIFLAVFGVGLLIVTVCIWICICTTGAYAHKRRCSFYGYRTTTVNYRASAGTVEDGLYNNNNNTQRCLNDDKNNNNNNNNNNSNNDVIEPAGSTRPANIVNERNDCPGCVAAAAAANSRSSMKRKSKNDELWTLSMIWCHSNDWCSGECGVDADDCIIGVVD